MAGSTLYPGAIDNDSTLSDERTTGDPIPAADHNNQSVAIIATQTKIGSGSSTPTSGKVLTGTGTGTSAWQDPTGGSSIYFNVTDYGATGDGVANDTAEIQAALDAANAAGGGVVYFPVGTYLISAALTGYAAVSLKGVSSKSSIITLSSTSVNAYNLTSGGEIDGELYIENIRFTGPGSGTGKGINISGVPLDYIVMRDVLVIDFGSHGVYLGGAIVSRLEGVTSTSNGGDGIYIDGTSSWVTSVFMSACYGNANTASGISIKKATYVQLSACAADANANGYYFLDIHGGSVAGCGAESNTAYSFKVEGDGTFGSNGVVLEGCYSYDVRGVGFYFKDYAIGMTMIGCEDNTPGVGATASIVLDSTATLVSISNTFAGTQTYNGVIQRLGNNSGNAILPNLNATNIKDSAGNTALTISPTASAVNGVTLVNAATGGSPVLVAGGTDTNISLYIEPKGTGDVRIADAAGNVTFNISHHATPANYLYGQSVAAGQAVIFGATGSDTDVYLDLKSKGAGTVRANGVDVDTISGTQALTNKTITDSTNNVMAKSLKSATTTVDVSAATAPSSGQVLTATSTTAATWQTPSAGGGLTWTEVTGTSQSAAVDNGYLTNNASLVTVTIPTTAAVGKIVRVAGVGAGGWKIAQNASEKIHFGISTTTTGTGGYLASTNRYDAVELVCTVADTEWSVISSNGSITIA